MTGEAIPVMFWLGLSSSIAAPFPWPESGVADLLHVTIGHELNQIRFCMNHRRSQLWNLSCCKIILLVDLCNSVFRIDVGY